MGQFNLMRALLFGMLFIGTFSARPKLEDDGDTEDWSPVKLVINSNKKLASDAAFIRD